MYGGLITVYCTVLYCTILPHVRLTVHYPDCVLPLSSPGLSQYSRPASSLDSELVEKFNSISLLLYCVHWKDKKWNSLNSISGIAIRKSLQCWGLCRNGNYQLSMDFPCCIYGWSRIYISDVMWLFQTPRSHDQASTCPWFMCSSFLQGFLPIISFFFTSSTSVHSPLSTLSLWLLFFMINSQHLFSSTAYPGIATWNGSRQVRFKFTGPRQCPIPPALTSMYNTSFLLTHHHNVYHQLYRTSYRYQRLFPDLYTTAYRMHPFVIVFLFFDSRFAPSPLFSSANLSSKHSRNIFLPHPKMSLCLTNA